MTDSKGKPGQGQWALLKLESCCDVIKQLFSTAMAGLDKVLAQKAFLEKNGCIAGRCYASDVIILSFFFIIIGIFILQSRESDEALYELA